MTARRSLQWSDGAAGPVLRAAVADWRLRAVCTPADEHLFFPPPSPASVLLINEAKAICARCPVRGECLDWALRHPGATEHGVWGGLHPAERRALSQPGRRIPVPVPVASKHCPSCDTPKDADEFFRDRKRPDGLDTNCKDCRSGARKARAAA